jgi:hypothetical protein
MNDDLRNDPAVSTDLKAALDRLLADVRMHDHGERAAVAQAYVNLVDCIATYREKHIALEDSRRIQKDS